MSLAKKIVNGFNWEWEKAIDKRKSSARQRFSPRLHVATIARDQGKPRAEGATKYISREMFSDRLQDSESQPGNTGIRFSIQIPEVE